jgi:drug/metabolite transporter (DMT)-like permease
VPVVGTGLATILAAVELPVVITLSAFVLLEKINILQWVGVIMILIGIFISESVINPHF